MNVPRPTSKSFILSLIGIVLIGIPVTFFAFNGPAILKNFAWSAQETATTQCSSTAGSAVIVVTFSNTESSKAMNVTAQDLQTGNSVNLGTVGPQDVKAGDIVTGRASLNSGSVEFNLTWANGQSGSDQEYATYKAVSDCPLPAPTTNFCPASGQNNQGECEWNPETGAQGYNVVVTNTNTNQIIQSVSVPATATESAFPMTPGIPYDCMVTPTNECGVGTSTTSPVKVCTGPQVPECVNGSITQGTCQWDADGDAATYNVSVTDTTTGQQVASSTVSAPTTQYQFPDNGTDTYVCSVSAADECGNSGPGKSPPSTCTTPTPTPTAGPTPTPTPTGAPTATPTLSPTPTPTGAPTATPTLSPTPAPTATPVPPTPTPVVIVTVLTSPPQQNTVQVPGQTQTVYQQGQTQTVVQQGPPQTVIQPGPTARPYSPLTPVPTMMATGDTTPTFIAIGTSAVLLFAGGIIFFLL